MMNPIIIKYGIINFQSNPISIKNYILNENDIEREKLFKKIKFFEDFRLSITNGKCCEDVSITQTENNFFIIRGKILDLIFLKNAKCNYFSFEDMKKSVYAVKKYPIIEKEEYLYKRFFRKTKVVTIPKFITKNLCYEGFEASEPKEFKIYGHFNFKIEDIKL